MARTPFAKLTESEVVPRPTLQVVREACTGTGTHTTLAKPSLNQSESLSEYWCTFVPEDELRSRAFTL